ncbi:MAG: LptF/LptG family permease, partial [Armatimonadota bacterium]
RPVLLFGLVIALLTFAINEFIVPPASFTAVATRAGMEKDLKASSAQPTNVPLLKGDKTVGYIMATDTDILARRLKNVTVVMLDDKGGASSVLQAPGLEFNGLKNWTVIGESTLYGLKNKSEVTFHDGVWPAGISKPEETFDDIITRTIKKDLDAFSMDSLRREIAKLERDPNHSRKDVANLKFGFWNKIATPLAALFFGLLGAPLGIRNHRAGAATGFAISIAIIFCYMLLTNTMNIFNENGRIEAWMASFTPTVIGLVCAAWLIHRRNGQ